MKSKVAHFIREQHLFASTDKLLVALSGGADSVALLRILLELGYTCEAAHCNFHLRGEESCRDEEFVRQLCDTLSVPLHVVHFDTAHEAKLRKVSIEMAARELRYAWFEEVRKACGAQVVAVAHHQDDSVETFLLNLLRGTGIKGLQGIHPKNGFIVRPLLCLSRQEVTQYLDSLHQPYVTDSTNLQDEYTRNKIRLHLLPLMEEIHPAAKANIQKASTYLAEAATIYNKGIADARKRIESAEGLNIEALLKEEAAETVLYEVLSPLGFNSAQVKDIFLSLEKQSGKQFVSNEWRVIKDRKTLLLEKIETAEKPRLTMEEYVYDSSFVIPREKDTACFDADKLQGEWSLRLWKQGDSFVPFGMKGRKLVSDYLTDRKFSISRKEQQWVLCCGTEICWLVGERSDNRYRVDQATRKVIVVRRS